jgi:hypothetical protein
MLLKADLMTEVVKDHTLMLFGYQRLGVLLSQIIVDRQVFGSLLPALLSSRVGEHVAL